MADTLYRPEADLFTLIKSAVNLAEVNVYQVRPEVLEDLSVKSSILFSLSNNNAKMTIDKGIAWQSIEVEIHILALKRKTAGQLLVAVTGVLNDNGYELTYSNPNVPDPDGIAHTVARFNLTY